MWKWRNKPPMERPFYGLGDRVRVWKVLRRPLGRIQEIFEKSGLFEYEVRYEYHDGRYFTEVFESVDLTLYERYDQLKCTCASNSNIHKDYCFKYNKR